jgi:hypothetical protein
MSALPPKADIGSACRHVRFVPKRILRDAAKRYLFDHLSARTSNEGENLSPSAARLVKLSPKRFSSATGGASCGGWLIWEHTRFRGLGFRQNPVDASKQSYCLGYVAGVSDVLVGMHIVCIGEHASVRQIAHVVVQYLREHPGRRNMDADDLTATALALAFPCK